MTNGAHVAKPEKCQVCKFNKDVFQWLCLLRLQSDRAPLQPVPPFSSRPSRLLFLGLSLGVLGAAGVGACLAQGSHPLQPSCQLQQQGNQLGEKASKLWLQWYVRAEWCGSLDL